MSKGSPFHSATILAFTLLVVLLQVSVAVCKPIGAEPSLDSIIRADILIRSLAAGDIDPDKMNQNQYDKKLTSIELGNPEPIALSPDDLNAVNAAKVQSWQTIQSAKEFVEAQARAEKEQKREKNYK